MAQVLDKELYRQGEGEENLCMMYAYFLVSMCCVSVHVVCEACEVFSFILL